MKQGHMFAVVLAAMLLFAPIGAFAQGPVFTDETAPDHFVVSGAVGGAFGGDTIDSSVGFDGAFDYLRRGRYGLELLATFTPDLGLDTAGAVTPGDTRVNTYMFNGIGALPLGLNDNWMPYVSGGLGILTIRNDIDLGSTEIQVIDEEQFGGNLGFGVMAFRDQLGFRADVRYFTGFGNDVALSGSPAVNLGEDVNFWRSTAGVAFRW